MNWLRKRREEIGIDTQDELAARLQLEGESFTRAAISHWENDRNNPPLDLQSFRESLARVLELSVPEMLALAGYEVAQGEHSAAGERAAYIVDELPEEKRNLAIRLLEQLIAG